MTNTPRPSGQSPHDDDSRPLRRPGWSLIQDVRPRQARHSADPVQPEARQQPATTTLSRNPPALQATVTRKQRLFQWLHKHALVVASPLIVIASIRLSAFPVVGEGLIVVYGVVAVVRRVPSRVSFWLATVVLVSIGIEFLPLSGAGRANNSALFVFLLLGVGLICSMLETRRMGLRDKASRRR